MRRFAALAALALWLMACTPTPTVTATPSTLAPGCTEITTVTGKGTPASEIRNVVLEVQRAGTWRTWVWFQTGGKTEQWGEIRSSVKADGTYELRYYRPRPGEGTVRLRVRGMKLLSDPGVVSKSWYVTAPASCPT